MCRTCVGHVSDTTSWTPAAQQSDICNSTICEVLNNTYFNQQPVTPQDTEAFKTP